MKLQTHDFVAHQQSVFTQETKHYLQDGKVTAAGNSAKNYSFIVQDAAQGFHNGTISKPQYIHLCGIPKIIALQQDNCDTSAMLLSLTA